MNEKIISICKNGKRYDIPVKIEKYGTSDGADKAWDTRGRGKKSDIEQAQPLGDKQINHAEYQEKLKSKTDEELQFIARDAYEASKANPQGSKSGYYQDEVNYATMEMNRRGKEVVQSVLPKKEFDDIFDKYNAKDYFGYKASNEAEVKAGGKELYSKEYIDRDKQKSYDFITGSRLPQMMRGEMPPQREKLSWEVYNKIKDKLPSKAQKMLKQEPIASDEPVISTGAIVSMNGHKGKVLQTEGDEASVSWEDASISKVPIKGLKYEGRVAKGGPGSGPRPGGEKSSFPTKEESDASFKTSAKIRADKEKAESERLGRIKNLERKAKIGKGGPGSGPHPGVPKEVYSSMKDASSKLGGDRDKLIHYSSLRARGKSHEDALKTAQGKEDIPGRKSFGMDFGPKTYKNPKDPHIGKE